MRADIGVQHLMASSGFLRLPGAGAAIEDRTEYFGDGSMRCGPRRSRRHGAPGRHRILIIGAGRLHEPPGVRSEYPTCADRQPRDVEHLPRRAGGGRWSALQRINATLKLLRRRWRAPSLQADRDARIAPSQRLDDLAAKHLGSLPAPVRGMLRGVGVSGRGEGRGAALASYLLFESPHTQSWSPSASPDTIVRRDEVRAFFSWT